MVDAQGLSRDRRSVELLDLRTGTTREMGVMESVGNYFLRVEGTILALSEPFGPGGYVAAGNGSFWMGSADSYSIYSFDLSGPRFVVRRLLAGAAVNAEEQRLFRERDMDPLVPQSSAVRTAKRQHYSRVRFPERMPLFQGLQVDRLGNLWVREYRAPWGPRVQRWYVHASDGRLLGTVQIPGELSSTCAFEYVIEPCRTILEIGSDYMLVATRDAFDVRKVSRHRLVKP
jgi:hypothetical protein